MTRKPPPKIKQRTAHHADEDMVRQHSVEIRRILETIEHEQAEFDGKWMVLGIMLLLLMLPVVYLFAAGAIPQPHSASGESNQPALTRPGAVQAPLASMPAPPQAETGAVIKELELDNTLTTADAAPASVAGKRDPVPNTSPASKLPAIPIRDAVKPYRKNDRRNKSEYATLNAQPADGHAAQKPETAQPEPVTPVADSRGMQAEKRAEFNREIVMRTPGESIQSLINRCRALGLIEGELCRVRICSGIWGKDPACPATAHAGGN
jgi:hypothetical protein